MSDAIQEAINNLTHCKNIRYVSEAIILFLAKREKENLLLSTTDGVSPSLLSSTSNNTTSTTIFSPEENSVKKKSYFKRKRSEIIDIPDDELKRSGFCLGHWFTSFLAIVVILALFLITFYMIYKITLKLNQVTPQKTPGVFVNVSNKNFQVILLDKITKMSPILFREQLT